MPHIHYTGTVVNVTSLGVEPRHVKTVHEIMIKCGGHYLNNPFKSSKDYLMDIQFPTSAQYGEFAKRVYALHQDITEVRSDSRFNYIRNRIKLFFRNLLGG